MRAWRASRLGGRDAASGRARPLARDQRGGRVRSPASRWGGGVWVLSRAARSGEAESGSPFPLWAATAAALSAGDLWWRRRVGRRPPSCGRTKKGPARRGRLPPRPGSFLGAGRKPGQTWLRGGTRCSFVRAEWGGGSCCHVVAPVFRRRLSTRALWEGVKGRAEEKAVQQRVVRPWPASVPRPHLSVQQTFPS